MSATLHSPNQKAYLASNPPNKISNNQIKHKILLKLFINIYVCFCVLKMLTKTRKEKKKFHFKIESTNEKKTFFYFVLLLALPSSIELLAHCRLL